METGYKGENMAKVTFDVERCKGCGLCETVCPKQIIALSKEPKVELKNSNIIFPLNYNFVYYNKKKSCCQVKIRCWMFVHQNQG